MSPIHTQVIPNQSMIMFLEKKIVKCRFCAAWSKIRTQFMKGGSVFEHCEGPIQQRVRRWIFMHQSYHFTSVYGGCYSGKGTRWATMRPSGILQFSGMLLILMIQHTPRHDAVFLVWVQSSESESNRWHLTLTSDFFCFFKYACSPGQWITLPLLVTWGVFQRDLCSYPFSDKLIGILFFLDVLLSLLSYWGSITWSKYVWHQTYEFTSPLSQPAVSQRQNTWQIHYRSS